MKTWTQISVNLVLQLLFHVSAERMQEASPKKVSSGDRTQSLAQRRTTAGKIPLEETDFQASLLDVGLKQIMDKGPNLVVLEVEPQWFTGKIRDLQLEADNQTFFHDKCNAVADPRQRAMEDARKEHAKCRMEERTVRAVNVTQNCTDEKKHACDKMQLLFEESYCDYAESKQAFCSEMESCHAAADATWTMAEKHVQQLVQHLQHLFILRARLECQVAAWPVTASKQKCEDLSPDASHLHLTYPKKPTPNPCIHPVTPVPGDSSWSGAEYLDKPWTDLVQPVTACTTTTTTTTTQAILSTPGSQCREVADQGVNLGKLGNDCMGLAISEDNKYVFVGNRALRQLSRFEIKGRHLGARETLANQEGIIAIALHPVKDKLYCGSWYHSFLLECATTPGGNGCVPVKDKSGKDFDGKVYGRPYAKRTYSPTSQLKTFVEGIFINPNQPDKVWLTPHAPSFGYWDLKTQTNHIITMDLDPIRMTRGLTLNADSTKMFISGQVGIVEWTFATNSKRTITVAGGANGLGPWDVRLWPDVNGKKVLWNGMWRQAFSRGTYRQNARLTCYENCSVLGETVKWLKHNDNSGTWNMKGNKFYGMREGNLYEFAAS